MNLKLLKKPSFIKSRLSVNKDLIQRILISLFVVLMVGGTFFYLFQNKDLEKTALGGILSGIFANLSETEEEVEQDLISEEKTKSDYEEEASFGDGLTHLARKSLSRYLQENEINDLTVEHKIYIEDYIQKKLGSQNLSLGEKVTIPYSLVSEAVNNSRNLTESQLNNLEQYSLLVSSI